jgi:PleD family two-component response regulator
MIISKTYNDIELNAKIYAALRTKRLQDELRQKNKQLTELLTKLEALAITDSLTGLYNEDNSMQSLGGSNGKERSVTSILFRVL